MSKFDVSPFSRTEFPLLDAQRSNYAGWLESLQASTRAKSHKHYKFSRFIEKSYLIKITAGFKTLDAAEKEKPDAFSSRTASAEPSKRATRSGQSASEPENSRFEEQ